MRILVIGGTGHIGTYLVPRLVQAGHEVIVMSRQQRKPCQAHEAWGKVEIVEMDRVQMEASNEFSSAVARLALQVVIDLICFDRASARQLIDGIIGKVEHLLHCGSMWVHGYKTEMPSLESHPRRPIGEYGRLKADIEQYLLNEVDQDLLPVTIIHPGHIVGPGWTPVNPQGNFNRELFSKLARGEEILMPNFGLETLHHVHADDVALGFMQAIDRRYQAKGQAFQIVSESAITCRGYAEAVAGWYGQSANLRFVSWDDFKQSVSSVDAEQSWEHLQHSTSGSIEKARRLLNYQPRYSSMEAIRESLTANC